MRLMPAMSGTVSMSKTSSGIIRPGRIQAATREARRWREGIASGGEYARGEVPVAAVADDEDDRRVRDALRQTERDRAGAARADAAEDAFVAREPPRVILGVGLRHVLGAIDAARVEYLRQIRGRPFANARDRRPLLRLRADDRDRGILFLEKPRHAHDRPGGTHCRDEMRDPASGVAPDLGPRAAVMRERIVRIRELVEDDALAFVTHAHRDIARGLHAARLRRQ